MKVLSSIVIDDGLCSMENKNLFFPDNILDVLKVIQTGETAPTAGEVKSVITLTVEYQ